MDARPLAALTAALFVGLAGLAGCSKQPDTARTERSRAIAYDHCMSSAQNEDTGLPRKIVESYCTCAADKLVVQLSPADLIRIYQAGDETMTRELEPILQECLDKVVEEASADSSAVGN